MRRAIWAVIAGLSRLRMPRWSLPVLTGLLAPCCYAVAYSTHNFLFALLMATFAIITREIPQISILERQDRHSGVELDGE